MSRTRFHSLLRAKIEERMGVLAEEAASGMAKDFPAYREYVGQFRAYQDCLKMCEDIEAEFDSQ